MHSLGVLCFCDSYSELIFDRVEKPLFSWEMSFPALPFVKQHSGVVSLHQTECAGVIPTEGQQVSGL